jgi:hypothetical protein
MNPLEIRNSKHDLISGDLINDLNAELKLTR